MESSQTREQTHVPCIGRWTTREVPRMGFLKDALKKYVAATAADWTSGVELGEGVVRVPDVWEPEFVLVPDNSIHSWEDNSSGCLLCSSHGWAPGVEAEVIHKDGELAGARDGETQHCSQSPSP